MISYFLGKVLLSGSVYWDREVPKKEQKKSSSIEEKESIRWIDIAQQAKKTLEEAHMVTHIGDRENDIYDFICRIPDEKNHVLIRSSQNRNVFDYEGKLTNLSSVISSLPAKFSYTTELPLRAKKRKESKVIFIVKYTDIELIRPKSNKDNSLPEKIKVTVIDVQEENNSSEKSSKIHWRLITDHVLKNDEDAVKIIEFYRARWNIEQVFRTMKTKGIEAGETQVNKKTRLYKIMIIALLSSIKIMQLVMSREGKINRDAFISFTKKELDCMETLIKKYEGKTEKQKNPHPYKSLAWCSWLIARLGGWKGYQKSEGPAGPITLKDGLCRFKSIFEGWKMVLELE